MKDIIKETIYMDQHFSNDKVSLKRKCSGKFEIFLSEDERNGPLLSMENMEGDHFRIGSDFFGLGMDYIFLKYEADYIRQLGDTHEL